MIRDTDPDLLDKYYNGIGKVAAAVGQLEEAVIQFTAILCDPPQKPLVIHKKMLLRGMAKNLLTFRKRVSSKASESNYKKLEPLLDRAAELNKTRNEIVHAVWSKMVDANSGETVGVARSRYVFDKNLLEAKWDVKTPNLAEVLKTADDVFALVAEIEKWFQRVWDTDDRIVEWRMAKNSN